MNQNCTQDILMFLIHLPKEGIPIQKSKHCCFVKRTILKLLTSNYTIIIIIICHKTISARYIEKRFFTTIKHPLCTRLAFHSAKTLNTLVNNIKSPRSIVTKNMYQKECQVFTIQLSLLQNFLQFFLTFYYCI